MRGTLHTIPSDDAHWVLRLLALRILAATSRRYQQLGLDDGLCLRAFHRDHPLAPISWPPPRRGRETPVLMFDEPLNGLDPQGVKWLRDLLRQLAGEGRTVFVSSHLMSEMEHTADQLVVIGRGELIAAESLARFSARGTRRSVTVGTAAAPVLRELLTAEGAAVHTEGDLLTVTGLTAAHVSQIAQRHRVPLHRLETRSASLEEAFMELTADSVQYSAGDSR